MKFTYFDFKDLRLHIRQIFKRKGLIRRIDQKIPAKFLIINGKREPKKVNKIRQPVYYRKSKFRVYVEELEEKTLPEASGYNSSRSRDLRRF